MAGKRIINCHNSARSKYGNNKIFIFCKIAPTVHRLQQMFQYGQSATLCGHEDGRQTVVVTDKPVVVVGMLLNR